MSERPVGPVIDLAEWVAYLRDIGVRELRVRHAPRAGRPAARGPAPAAPATRAPQASPALLAQMHEILEKFPEAKWHQWDPAGRSSVYLGAERAFERIRRPIDMHAVDRAPDQVVLVQGLPELTRQGCRRMLRRVYAAGAQIIDRVPQRGVPIPKQYICREGRRAADERCRGDGCNQNIDARFLGPHSGIGQVVHNNKVTVGAIFQRESRDKKILSPETDLRRGFLFAEPEAAAQ